ncbi:MAG: hypothetical protein EPN62_08515 [Candidimonas sp.]|nr:MAG: hypothetical protein EPN77_03390 [Candidimonas sp.]TAM23810.1 MAG: hypothetical protein EPN62_08515 [Candidimonas sp.]
MAYRNGTYIAFHAGDTADPTASDIKYYNTMKMWSANKKIEFILINSHEKTSAVRDSLAKETLRRSLIAHLNNSKHMVLIEQFGVLNTAYPENGYGFYNRDTQVGWGFIKP